MTTTSMRDYFYAIADSLRKSLQAGERFTASFSAEQTDFVRMNRGKVRQPGTVAQRYLTVRLIRGVRHAEHCLSLAGDPAADATAIRDAVAGLRSALPELADDPLLLLPTDVVSNETIRSEALAPAEEIVGQILDAAHGNDLVGIYAAGPVWRGFANSEGQRNWHEATTFNLDWSLYHQTDKAVKSGYAGFAWDAAAFALKMSRARDRLALMSRPAKSLAPGKYRAFLAPSALEDIVQMLCWGGFSGRMLATKQSPLSKMQQGALLNSAVSLTEDTAGGVAPAFQSEGFARPASIGLVADGSLVGSLVSPRTAREFTLDANGANGEEVPESLVMTRGALPTADALAALDTGLMVGNLHYLNYSDRPACRMTGMTRFATFWVEDGQVVAPINVLRFDDTAYRMLGANLESLTAETELLLDGGSYGSRKLSSLRLPGALVREMSFVL